MSAAPAQVPPLGRITIVGAGRLGRALAAALRAAGAGVEGPLGRGATGEGADVVLLCVPDAEIARAAAHIAAGPVLGHCSGATTLEPLGPRSAFSLHPLLSVTGDTASFAGAACAVAATDERARAVAEAIAHRLRMTPFAVAESARALYHAAASMASNYLVTLEDAAERLARGAGVPRSALAPLVRASVENWLTLGGRAALTGPIVRGDEATVERQRAAVAANAPALLSLWDSLADATRALAAHAS